MNNNFAPQKEYVRIPMDRIGVIIGPEGAIKKEIEHRSKIDLIIDSENGTIELVTNSATEDPLAIFRAKAVCEAIGLGFSPPRAFKLFEQEVMLKIIDLKSVVGKRGADLPRIKGRVIGEQGKARIMIEELTGVRVSVYGTFVAIIGPISPLRVADEAINMLIDGAFHKTVFNFLFKKRRDLKMAKARFEVLERNAASPQLKRRRRRKTEESS